MTQTTPNVRYKQYSTHYLLCVADIAKNLRDTTLLDFKKSPTDRLTGRFLLKNH